MKDHAMPSPEKPGQSRRRLNLPVPKRPGPAFLGLVLLGLTVLGPAVPTRADVAHGPWVITTDYGVFGGIEALEAGAPWTPSGALAVIPGDAVGRYHEGLLYIVGRGGANLVQVYDPVQDWLLLREFSIGSGRNPQDIAFAADGSAWISCYDEAVLLKVDPEAGTILEVFDTSAYADADGLPETGWLLLHEDRLYITCQKLDRGGGYAPTGPGALLVMDVVTGQWQDPVALQGANPYTRIRLNGDGKLLVGCAGYWALADAGIEQVDPATGQSEGLILTEAQLGGDVLNFVPTDDETLFLLTSSASFVTSLKRARPATGQVTVLATSAGYDMVDLVFDGDFQLMLADRDLAAPGIRVFDTVSGAELTEAPVPTDLPPFMIIWREPAGLSGVPFPDGQLGVLRLDEPYPNPCNPAAEVVIHDRAGQAVAVSVLDLRGRRVATDRLVCDAGGRATYRFGGRDALGTALPAGLYRVVASSPQGFAVRTLTLVK